MTGFATLGLSLSSGITTLAWTLPLTPAQDGQPGPVPDAVASAPSHPCSPVLRPAGCHLQPPATGSEQGTCREVRPALGLGSVLLFPPSLPCLHPSLGNGDPSWQGGGHHTSCSCPGAQEGLGGHNLRPHSCSTGVADAQERGVPPHPSHSSETVKHESEHLGYACLLPKTGQSTPPEAQGGASSLGVSQGWAGQSLEGSEVHSDLTSSGHLGSDPSTETAKKGPGALSPSAPMASHRPQLEMRKQPQALLSPRV